MTAVVDLWKIKSLESMVGFLVSVLKSDGLSCVSMCSFCKAYFSLNVGIPALVLCHIDSASAGLCLICMPCSLS